jgi:U6 snRNA-associated Sm-like protein LSm7
VDAVVGILKGYDQLMNLVLDEVKETMRGMLHPVGKLLEYFVELGLMRTIDEEGNEHTRELGLVVARGPMLTLISPVDGSERIENPFLQQEVL